VKPTQYRIVVTGELGSRYATAFEPMRLTTRNGETEIVGLVEDDAELSNTRGSGLQAAATADRPSTLDEALSLRRQARAEAA
jgi:hypothetical protein